MAKMHFAEHTLFTLFRGLGAGKMGKIRDMETSVWQFMWGGIHVRVIQTEAKNKQKL